MKKKLAHAGGCPTRGPALRSWKDETRGGDIIGDLHCSVILEHILLFLIFSKQRCLHYLQTEDMFLMVLFSSDFLSVAQAMTFTCRV